MAISDMLVNCTSFWKGEDSVKIADFASEETSRDLNNFDNKLGIWFFFFFLTATKDKILLGIWKENLKSKTYNFPKSRTLSFSTSKNEAWINMLSRLLIGTRE